MSIQTIIFWLFLIDSVAANIVIWFGGKWYMSHPVLSKYFPSAKGWGLLYLVLVLWIGSLLGTY